MTGGWPGPFVAGPGTNAGPGTQEPPTGELPVAPPGRTVPVVSLVVTAVTTLLLGYGVYRLLASIELSFDPFGGIAVWGTVALAGLALGPFACGLGIWAAVRCRRLAIGWVALVAALVLPVTGGGVGLVQGVDKVQRNTVGTVVEAGNGIACLVGEEGWGAVDQDALERVLDEANQ